MRRSRQDCAGGDVERRVIGPKPRKRKRFSLGLFDQPRLLFAVLSVFGPFIIVIGLDQAASCLVGIAKRRLLVCVFAARVEHRPLGRQLLGPMWHQPPPPLGNDMVAFVVNMNEMNILRRRNVVARRCVACLILWLDEVVHLPQVGPGGFELETTAHMITLGVAMKPVNLWLVIDFGSRCGAMVC